MNTKQPEALRLAHIFEHPLPPEWSDMVAATKELRRQHTEIETLRTGYDAARLEIASLRERVQMLGQLARDVNSRRVTELEAQLAAVGAGGVESLRKRECLHKISEPAQPVARIRYERNTPGRENEMPRVVSCNRMADGVYEVFTASQVQAMLAAAPRNATLYDPDDVAFPIQRSADGTDALPPELASIAAAEVAAPINTLKEAIAHAKEVAKGNSACALEHAKLAAWLTELQLWRDSSFTLAVGAELRKQYEALIRQMLAALEHHTEQTRPITRTDDAITAARLRLESKP